MNLRASKRGLRNVCWISIAACALLAGWLWTRGSALYPALDFARDEVAFAENAVPRIASLAQYLAWPDARFEEMREQLYGGVWDEALVAGWVEDHQQVLDRLRLALDLPAFQVPRSESLDAPSDLLNTFRRAGLLLLLEAELRFRQGAEADAFVSLFEALDFGHRIEGSGGIHHHCFAGSAIKLSALGQLRRFATATDLPDALLLEAVRKLDGYWADDAGFAQALRAEFQLFRLEIAQESTGRAPGQGNPLLARLVSSVALDPSRTERMAADIALTSIASLSRTGSGASARNAAVAQVSPRVRLSRPNPIGQAALDLNTGAWEALPVRRWAENASVAATQTFLALRCYSRKHGRLPERLSRLVPEYLPAPPVDAFDGGVLRFDPARAIVYSVGQNFADDGGRPTNDPANDVDIVFHWEALSRRSPGVHAD